MLIAKYWRAHFSTQSWRSRRSSWITLKSKKRQMINTKIFEGMTLTVTYCSWHQLIDLDLPCTQGVSGLLYSVDSTLKVYSIPAYLVYTQFVLRFARILQVNIFPGNCSYNAARPDLYGVGSGIPDPEKCCQNGEKQPGWGMVKAIDLRAYFLVRSMFAFRKSLLANLCAAAGAAVYFQFSSAAMQTFTKANSQNFQKLKTIMNNKWYCKTNVSQ